MNINQILRENQSLSLCNGVWGSHEKADKDVSFPPDAHNKLMEIEDKSFWFCHRNNCISAVFSQFKPDGYVLDVGGGNGYVTKRLQDDGCDIALIEPLASGVVNAAKRNVKNACCCLLDDSGLPEASAGGICLFDVIEHLKDESIVLSQCKKLLKKDNGRLYVTVPAWNWLWSNIDKDSGHHRRYSPKTLKYTLKRSGFNIEYMTFLFSVLPVPMFFSRCLRRVFTKADEPLQDIDSEHSSSGFLQKCANHVWNWEYARLKKGKTIPIGASLLVVAKPI